MEKLRDHFSAQLHKGIVMTSDELNAYNRKQKLGISKTAIKKLKRFFIYLSGYEDFGKRSTVFANIGIPKYRFGGGKKKSVQTKSFFVLFF